MGCSGVDIGRITRVGEMDSKTRRVSDGKGGSLATIGCFGWIGMRWRKAVACRAQGDDSSRTSATGGASNRTAAAYCTDNFVLANFCVDFVSFIVDYGRSGRRSRAAEVHGHELWSEWRG